MHQSPGQSNSSPSKAIDSDAPRADASQDPRQQAPGSPEQVAINISDVPGQPAQKPPSNAHPADSQPLVVSETQCQSSPKDTNSPLASSCPKTKKPMQTIKSARCIKLERAVPDIIFTVVIALVLALMLICVFSHGWTSDDDSLEDMAGSDSTLDQVTSILMLIGAFSSIASYLYVAMIQLTIPFELYSSQNRARRILLNLPSAFISWLEGVVAMCVFAGQDGYVGWPFILSLLTIPALLAATVYGCMHACKLKTGF